MGLETIVNIADLIRTNPPGSDPKSQGDDHIRGIKTALLNDIVGYPGAVTVTGTDGGVVNAYTLTPAFGTLIAYGNRMQVEFSPTVTNTGAVTLNISGLGAKNVLSVSGAPLIANDLVAGNVYGAFYNGTEFRLLSITKNYADQLAFGSALPAQSLGLLISTGTVASFSTTLTGFALNEVKGADIASSATVNLTTATGNLVHITGTTTITAITIPSGAERTLVFDGALTLTHNATTLILPTGANIVTAAGDACKVRGDGAGNARVVSFMRANGQPLVLTPTGDHEVVVNTGNGVGSTNTAIRRFSTIVNNVGTAITYADSATLGSTFTINETGLYAITYNDTGTTSIKYGVSLNSNQLTTSIDSITASTRLVAAESPSSFLTCCSRSVRLSAGDVIRPHAAPGLAYTSTAYLNQFSIRKIGI